MPQITWKNIAAPDGGGALKAMDKAGDRLSGAFDPMEKLLKERQAMDAENYKNEGENINKGIQESFQDINNLGDLNQRQAEGQFKDSLYREQYGARYDSAAKEQAFTKQQGVLRDEAMNSLMPEVNAHADENLSLVDSVSLFEKRATEMGMTPNEIKKRSAGIMNDPAREALYSKTRKDNLNTLLTEIGPLKNRKAITEQVDAARQRGDKINFDTFEQKLNQEMVNNRNDLSYAQQQNLYHRLEGERIAMDNFSSGIQKDLAGGMDYNNAYAKNSRNLSGSQLMTAAIQSKQFHELKSKLDPEQEAQYTQMDKGAQANLMNHQADLEAHNASLQKGYEDATGITSVVKDRVKGMEKGATGIVKALSQDSREGEWFHFNNFSLKKQGSDAAAALAKPLADMKGLGIPEDEAKSLILLAYDDSVADNITWLNGNAVNKGAIHQAVEKRIENWKNSKGLKAQWIRDVADSKKEMRNATTLMSNSLTGFRIATRKGNRTGTYEDSSKYAQELGNMTPTLPEKSFGVLGRYDAEIGEAKMQALIGDQLGANHKTPAISGKGSSLSKNVKDWDVSTSSGQEYEQKDLYEQMTHSKESFAEAGDTLSKFPAALSGFLGNKADSVGRLGSAIKGATSTLYVTGADGKRRPLTEEEEALYKALGPK